MALRQQLLSTKRTERDDAKGSTLSAWHCPGLIRWMDECSMHPTRMSGCVQAGGTVSMTSCSSTSQWVQASALQVCLLGALQPLANTQTSLQGAWACWWHACAQPVLMILRAISMIKGLSGCHALKEVNAQLASCICFLLRLADIEAAARVCIGVCGMPVWRDIW